IGGSNLSITGSDTIFSLAPLGEMPLMHRKLIVSFVIALVFKLILDLYFKTKSGLLLRAVGDNSTLVSVLAKDNGSVKILGLVISNALVALSGSVVCQEQRSFSSTMGTGQIVFGLATVIIGTTVFKKLGFVKGTTAVVFGSIIYKACIQVAISLGLPTNLLKLITAVLFLVILVMGNLSSKGGKRNARA
ncbi:MAG: ABC transporter permease, partial [Oscillospiraceae bacterium]